MKREKYLVVHSLDTPSNMYVTKGMLEEWHKGPRDNKDGTVTYLGKTYENRIKLPPDRINGIKIKILNGRGWDRLGYTQIIHRDGHAETVTPYDGDGIVQQHEVTWGATGINQVSRHIALEGGKTNKGKLLDFFELFTESQFVKLMSIINHELDVVSQVKVIGHNQVSDKLCPGFDVEKFLKKVGIPEKSIGL